MRAALALPIAAIPVKAGAAEVGEIGGADGGACLVVHRLQFARERLAVDGGRGFGVGGWRRGGR